jgi:hypothetical protein
MPELSMIGSGSLSSSGLLGFLQVFCEGVSPKKSLVKIGEQINQPRFGCLLIMGRNIAEVSRRMPAD